METLNNVTPEVLDILEESNPPVFWSTSDEVQPLLVEAMMFATLLTGEPEVLSAAPINLAQNVNLQAMPAGALAILQVVDAGGKAIKKTFVQDLDLLRSGWENDTDVSLGRPGVVKYWFPVGLTQWGVYPKQTGVVPVTPSFVGIPVTAARPYTGAEQILFQSEFNSGFIAYAGCMARLKEGTTEFEEAVPLFEQFLGVMEQLTKFAARKDVFRFSLLGRPAKIADITVR